MQTSIAHLRGHWAVFLGLIIALAVWCAVDVSRRARVDPAHPERHMTDLTVYTEAGLAFFDGREPYEVANIRGWKYLYPPLFALLISPLGQFAPQWQAAVWFAISVLMAFGIYFECRRLLSALWRVGWVERSEAHQAEPWASLCSTHSEDRPADDRTTRWIWIAAGTAALLPTLNCLQRGQMGVALLYFLLLGLRLVMTGRWPLVWLAGGAILALPVVLKLTPLLPAGCALLLPITAAISAAGRPGSAGLAEPGRLLRTWALWSTSGCLAGGFLFLLLLPAALIGWNTNLRHLGTWYEKVVTKVDDVRTEDFGGGVDSPRNQSLANAAYRCGNWLAYEFANGPYDQVTGKAHGKMPMDEPVATRILLGLRGLALVALLLATIRAARSGNGLLWGAAFGLAGVATLVVSPVARGHYFMFLLPAILFISLWLLERGERQRALRMALFPALLVVAHYALLKYAGRAGLLGLGTTLWYFTACAKIGFSAAPAIGAATASPAAPPIARSRAA